MDGGLRRFDVSSFMKFLIDNGVSESLLQKGYIDSYLTSDNDVMGSTSGEEITSSNDTLVDENFTTVQRKRKRKKKTIDDNTKKQKNQITKTLTKAEHTEELQSSVVKEKIKQGLPQLINIAKGVATNVRGLPKPPPIVCYRLDVSHLQRHVRGLAIKVNYKITNLNKTKSIIRTDSRADHEAIVKYTKEQQIESFTHAFKEDKSQAIVIKGVHHSFNTDEIKTELQAVLPHIEVRSVSTLSNKSTNKTVFNNFIVRISGSSKMADLVGLKYLLNQKIYWEKLIKKDVTQCYKCQHFGHMSSNCMMKSRCVKCNVSHDEGESCSKPDDSPPTCVNCGAAGHPASYRGCPHHKELLRRIKDKKTKKLVTSPNNNFTFANKLNCIISSNSSKSYAGIVREGAVVAGSKSVPYNISANPNSIENGASMAGVRSFDPQHFCNREASELFGCDLVGLMSKINDFLPSYNALNSKLEKQAAYLQLVFNLCARNN